MRKPAPLVLNPEQEVQPRNPITGLAQELLGTPVQFLKENRWQKQKPAEMMPGGWQVLQQMDTSTSIYNSCASFVTAVRKAIRSTPVRRSSVRCH